MQNYRGYLIKINTVNDNGWGTGFFSLEDHPKKQISIKGIIKGMDKQVLYEIHGEVEEHVRYGKSFKITSYRKAPINSQQEQINFLAGPGFPGVGRKTAQIIVDYLQDDAIKILGENSDILNTIPHLDKSLIPIIRQGISDNLAQDGKDRLRYIFFEQHLKTSILDWLEVHFNHDIQQIETLLHNQFLAFAYDKDIASFDALDAVALHFGLSPTSAERIAYWAWKVVSEVLFNTGHTYTNKSIVVRQIRRKLSIDDVELIFAGLLYAKQAGILVLNDGKIYTKESYNDEILIAQTLTNLLKSDLPHKQDAWDTHIHNVEQTLKNESKLAAFCFDTHQLQALQAFMQHKILVLTGGPGTGKTTLIQAMVKLFQLTNPTSSFAIATPTGRAAGRIRETFLTSNATTIHKLLQAKDHNQFMINAKHPLKEQLIIIDECSMIDNHLFAALIQACTNATKIVLVGDPNQLPSVNYGNLLADLISSQTLPVVHLAQIHRQKDNAEVIDLAYQVLDQHIEMTDVQAKQHITYQAHSTSKQVLDAVCALVETHWTQLQDQANYLQIVCPMYAGELGIDAINAEIQYRFNPNVHDPKLVYQRGDYRFAVDDKIMFLRNEPEYDLSNGDVGKIISFNYTKTKSIKDVTCVFNHKQITITLGDFNDVKLAYATSVHKTQGSEYALVVFVVDEHNQHNHVMLNNALIYTAISRTQQHLYLFCQFATLANGVMRHQPARNTTLVAQLTNHAAR